MLRFGVRVSGFGFEVPISDLVFRIFWIRISGHGFRVSCFVFRGSGLEFAVEGVVGLRVQGFRFRI